MITAVALLIGAAALLLLWSGVKGAKPLDVLRSAATGKTKLPAK